MGFVDIFEKTWKDYKTNFKAIFIFILIFYGLFSIASFLISFVWIFLDENVKNLILNAHLIEVENLIIPWTYLSVNFLLSIIGLFLYFFIGAGLIAVSLKKKKFSFNDIIQEGKSFYFKYFGFVIVSMLFILGLLLLFIIPGIIFAVYWMFGIYVLYEEKNGILASLKKSRMIVKGKWWKTFGYLILISIIGMIFTSIVSLIALPTQIITTIQISTGLPLSIGIVFINSLLQVITNFLSQLIYLPFLILFIKNFYLEMKSQVNGKEKLRKKKIK